MNPVLQLKLAVCQKYVTTLLLTILVTEEDVIPVTILLIASQWQPLTLTAVNIWNVILLFSYYKQNRPEQKKTEIKMCTCIFCQFHFQWSLKILLTTLLKPVSYKSVSNFSMPLIGKCQGLTSRDLWWHKFSVTTNTFSVIKFILLFFFNLLMNVYLLDLCSNLRTNILIIG